MRAACSRRHCSGRNAVATRAVEAGHGGGHCGGYLELRASRSLTSQTAATTEGGRRYRSSGIARAGADVGWCDVPRHAAQDRAEGVEGNM